jgi:hypothetical protein
MKLLTVFFLSTLASTTVFAGVCDPAKSEDARKFECQSTGNESAITTKEGRIIFISKTACVELLGKTISVSLQDPGNGKIKMNVDKKSKSTIEAKLSDRVYPTGSLTNSYVDEISLKLTGLKTDAPKLSVERYIKHTLKKDELRYLADYSCTEI